MPDDIGSGVIDAIDTAAPVETVTDSGSTSEGTSTTTTTDETPVLDASSEGAEEGTVEENETTNADGSEKTPEEQAAFKTAAATKAAGADRTPVQIRAALKQLRDSNPDDKATQQAVKQLHGAYERYEAVKPLLGTGGVLDLKALLTAAGVKTVTEMRAGYQTISQNFDAVQATDELLYNADPTLAKNVYDDLVANEKGDNYGRVVGNFLDHLKEVDPESYEATAVPHVYAGLKTAGLPGALYNVQEAIKAGDLESAKKAMASIAGWWNKLDHSQSEEGKHKAWQAEQAKAQAETAKTETQKATTAYQNETASLCERENNTVLAKYLTPFLKMQAFHDFSRETKIDLGNFLKKNLYTALKSDANYQSTMRSMWQAKATAENKAKILDYHKSTVQRIASDIVAKSIQSRYPGYSRGGSAAGRVAAAAAKAGAQKTADTKAQATGKAQYVAVKPTASLLRDNVTYGGRQYSQSDLEMLIITGKGFIKGPNGPRLITWRR